MNQRRVEVGTVLTVDSLGAREKALIIMQVRLLLSILLIGQNDAQGSNQYPYSCPNLCLYHLSPRLVS
jgi:hypothetical protein